MSHPTDDEDSDDSSSIPMGIPGGGALTFLPVQASQNELPEENKANDSNDETDSDSDSTPLGIPGGGPNVLSFVSVQPDNAQDNHGAATPSSPSTSSSSSSGTPLGIPGGSDIVFVQTNQAPNTNAVTAPSRSVQLSSGTQTQSAQPGHKDESSSDSDSDDSSAPIGLPGGGTELTFYPPDMSQRNKVTNNDKHKNNKNDNNNNNNKNNVVHTEANSIGNNLSLLGDVGGGHMNMLSYDEDPDEDEMDAPLDVIDDNEEQEVDEQIQPQMSLSKTVAVADRKTPKINRMVNSSTLSDARREYEVKEQQSQSNAIWDIVYMTSSPLVCRADFNPNAQQQHQLRLTESTTRRSAPDHYAQSSDGVQTAQLSNSKTAGASPAKRGKKATQLLPLELLDVSRESEEFMNVLRSANRALCVVHETATTGNLIKAMTHKCRILHYSGHGFPSYLAFEDENSIGDTHMLQDIMFKKMVNKGDKVQLKFVFTSACHSEAVGKAFVSAGVPHVVSIDTKFEVSDEGAMTFTKYFYEALLCGRTIRDSFQLAKQSVQFISSSAKRDYEKFKLLPKKGNHDVCLFNNLHPGQLINQSLRLPPTTLPTTIKPFVGRSIDMRDIIHSLMAKKNESCRVLNIYGDVGVGKSAISIMVGRYLNDRKIYFKHGIYYVDCLKLITNHDATTLAEMLSFCVQKAFEDYNNHNAELPPQYQYRYDSKLSVLTNLQLCCRLGALFIIDDIDQLIYYYRTNDIDEAQYLFDVMFKILSEASDKIKFIIISKKICQEAFQHSTNSQLSPKTYQLKRLSSTDASSLFGKLTGGQWRDNDIKENIDIMSILKNNPLQIHEMAKLKNQWECQTLTKLADTYSLKTKLQRKQGLNYSNDSNSTLHNQFMKKTQQKQTRQQLIKQYIQNPAARQVWIKAHGLETCDYHKIFEVLKLEFTEYTFSKRKLQQNNLLDCFRDLGMNQDLTINIDKFDLIYAWFNGLTRLVVTLSDYYNQLNPIVIHGFVSREDAQHMLLKDKSTPVGTFIIRFRYKQPKSIAISYKQAHTISNLKCDLSHNNDSTFICGQKLMPLPQFILSFPPLTHLYHPQKPIPKQQVFHAVHAHQQPSHTQALPSWSSGSTGRSWNPSHQSQSHQPAQPQTFNAYHPQSQPQMHAHGHTHHPQQQPAYQHSQKPHGRHHNHHSNSNSSNGSNGNSNLQNPSFSLSRSYNPSHR